MNTASTIVDLLGLRNQPVAVTFCAEAPAGVPRIEQPAASGCTYWRFAASGRTFYTEASDHFGCPVGSFTHGVDLPADKAKELESLVGTMVQLQYLRSEEVAGIPRRTEAFGAAVYAPLSDTSGNPDVVLISGNARQVMLLVEAAQAAGVQTNPDAGIVGRPTCAAIPAVMRSNAAVSNLGCIGNRVYTELPDDEFYFAITGSRLAAVVNQLSTIVGANRELEKFHRQRAAAAAR
jgi:uncharacterized protein (DUF169 family)